MHKKTLIGKFFIDNYCDVKNQWNRVNSIIFYTLVYQRFCPYRARGGLLQIAQGAATLALGYLQKAPSGRRKDCVFRGKKTYCDTRLTLVSFTSAVAGSMSVAVLV